MWRECQKEELFRKDLRVFQKTKRKIPLDDGKNHLKKMSVRGWRKIATDTCTKIYPEGGQIPAWSIKPVEFKYGMYIRGSHITFYDNQRRKWVIFQQT